MPSGQLPPKSACSLGQMGSMPQSFLVWVSPNSKSPCLSIRVNTRFQITSLLVNLSSGQLTLTPSNSQTHMHSICIHPNHHIIPAALNIPELCGVWHSTFRGKDESRRDRGAWHGTVGIFSPPAPKPQNALWHNASWISLLETFIDNAIRRYLDTDTLFDVFPLYSSKQTVEIKQSLYGYIDNPLKCMERKWLQIQNDSPNMDLKLKVQCCPLYWLLHFTGLCAGVQSKNNKEMCHCPNTYRLHCSSEGYLDNSQ